jgi:sec-independent protein translocase protein TatA
MLAAGIGPIGPFEGLIILLVVVLIFGVNKVGDLGGALGKSVREFRKAARDPGDEKDPPLISSLPTEEPKQADGHFCSKCGAQLDGEVKFCAKCGAPTQAAVN